MSGSVQTFISYRRADAEDAAGRIYDALTSRFGDADVFMDVDAIEPGLDFAKVISEAVARCDALIAVIGRNWLTATDAKGRRRLDNPKDFVRIEIASALDRDVRVIPALVQGVEMPLADELPDQLIPLADRHAVNLSHDRFRTGLEKLIRVLESLEQARPEGEDRPVPAEASEPDPPRTETQILERDGEPSGSESDPLVIRLRRGGSDSYEVEATDATGDTATGEFRLPLSRLELENLVLRLGRPRSSGRWR